MKRLSKYFLICIDPIISEMDKKIKYEDDIEYKFSDDFDTEDSWLGSEDEDSSVELDDDIAYDSDEEESSEADELSETDELSLEPETEELLLDTVEDHTVEDDISDVDDEIYAHKPIHDETIIHSILQTRLFAYSTTDNRRVSLNKTDWATIARLSDIGMDRIFLDGKEVFVSGFNKISLKTDKNINLTTEQLRSRGLHDYAKRIEQLRC